MRSSSSVIWRCGCKTRSDWSRTWMTSQGSSGAELGDISTGPGCFLISSLKYRRSYNSSAAMRCIQTGSLGLGSRGTPEEREHTVREWLLYPSIRRPWRFKELVIDIPRLEIELESVIRRASEVSAENSPDLEYQLVRGSLRRRKPYVFTHAESGEHQ